MNSATAAADIEESAPPNAALAQSLVEDMSALVSPPDIYLKISDMISDDSASAQQMSEVIMRDPSLAARILKLVNSSYYALPSKVDTVSRAVAVIGMHELSSLVYSMCAVQSFSRISSRVTNMNTFWRHGVYVGLAAKALAQELNCLNTERLFIAGLLHDIGTLTINARFSEIAETAIFNAAGNEALVATAEYEALGFDHAYLGALMLERWHLPKATCDAIRYHHQPVLAKVTPLEASILFAADVLANYSGTGSFSEAMTDQDEIPREISECLELPEDFDKDSLLEAVDQQFIETIYLLLA
ncbi:MAG: HDOD domain-containing protein [Proteobacteria bacterium]|nr:HDOD domain-containing protein [Pseudomonadota bacterium]